jgi:hypothetical protein
MSRIRIRHLMVLVLYVAVALALMIPAIKTYWPKRISMLMGAAALASSAMLPLTALVVRPGPRRDWVFVLLNLLTWALLVTFLIVDIESISYSIVVILLCGVPSWLLFAQYKEYLIPRKCPRCLRKRVIPSMAQRSSQLYSVYICRSCDFEGPLARQKGFPICPSCRQDTLVPVKKPFTYSWCLNCGSRWKQVPPGAVQEASGPEDDRSYWLWSFGKWIRTRADRIAKRARPTE